MNCLEDKHAVPQYEHPPITEAYIEIQVKTTDGFDLAAAGDKFAAAVGEDYPSRSAITTYLPNIPLIGEQPVEAPRAVMEGWAFNNADRTYGASVRGNGFVFFRRYPYQNWGRFRAEAGRLWEIYREIAKPVEFQRLGMRYLNQLDLPLPFEDFKEYLRASPELPPELPQALRQYFFEAVGALKGMNGTLTINQGLVPPAKPDHASVMLDIYLSCNDGVPESNEGIWAVFDGMCVEKDEAFEACITEKMRELIR